MRTLLVVVVSMLATACASASTSPAPSSPAAGSAGSTSRSGQRHDRRHRDHGQPRQPSVPAGDMPRPALTPGVALGVTATQICRAGYASAARNVPESEKLAVYARYGVADVPYAHEVDHLISLELGGSNTIANLWPEPYAGRWGARTKDELENRLHDLVCAGRMPLRSAQRIEARDWVAAYRRYLGRPAARAAAGAVAAGRGGFYASSYGTAGTIYCADDPAWRSLSRRYLVHVASWLLARRRFPTYHLHRPC
jgi:hypothetical protein